LFEDTRIKDAVEMHHTQWALDGEQLSVGSDSGAVNSAAVTSRQLAMDNEKRAIDSRQ
jgi:hypothetical protein